MNERNSDARQSADSCPEGAPESAEYSGKSLEEALAKASEGLGIPPSELDYEVIKDSSHSILGFVRKGEVVVRVWLPSDLDALDEEDDDLDDGDDQEVVTAAPATTAPAASGTRRVLTRELDDEDTGPSEAALKGNPPELEEVATEVLATLIDKMGMIAAVEVVDEGGQLDPVANEITPMVLNAVGDDLGQLIGRRGETLRDLQFITRLILSRKLGAWPNVIIDVESYKAKRVTSLEALAKRMADEVRRTGRTAVLEPMPAYERRIIHLTLRDDPDVYTESAGEDEHRKVQIIHR